VKLHVPCGIEERIELGAEVTPSLCGVQISYKPFVYERRFVNVPFVISCKGTSGTSSAKTTAKPLGIARQHKPTPQGVEVRITNALKCQSM